ncbi:hypothetical protein TBLA_0I01790 [Henningerozyma blattae CBS 6284]|uniref:EamA domain-containing protein n=1 Tax=Henningerozyma blattae (strain ATCC 34711 / CBS 6284 / DSM 70876 / NBRC 10599 / NRRL Y-10934 / UCD 77-7) TaxID=1071380 RepID=I2H8Y5_HENB6|nr:hypothetical protein TBLA_0I01790 [Tetrapisispora blattae CBS 6284]CCH62837.1 hypothetical protein TBLA_0I01790 [Tetrapisispora blattae CBS 6284]
MSNSRNIVTENSDTTSNITSSNITGLPVFLTFLYFFTFLFIFPVSKFIYKFVNINKSFKKESTARLNATAPITPNTTTITSNSSETATSPVEGESDALPTTFVEQLPSLEPATSTSYDYEHFFKLFILSILLLIPSLSYNLSLSISPAFDTAIIQNVSIFEITFFLIGLFGQGTKKNIFRNYVISMITLLGVLLISYSKATSDLLAGKLVLNKETGELNDPFLFDRLKGALICGLGALPIGLFYVLWNKWFNNSKKNICTLEEQSKHITIIGLINSIILLPFICNLSYKNNINLLFKEKYSFWLPILVIILAGIIPHILSLFYLIGNLTPEYSITTNQGTIILMGVSEWLCEPNQTTIIRSEILGYLALTTGCILLSSTFKTKKKF